jgi:hypothetical protein
VLRDLERRLRAVEAARPRRGEFWITQDDGTVRGPNGEQMTREEAETLAAAAGTSLFFLYEEDLAL